MADISYEGFVSSLREMPPGFDPDPVELEITSIEGEDRPISDGTAKTFGECYVISTWGVRLTAAGKLSGFEVDSSAFRGGGPGAPMPKETFQQIEALLSQLPDDDGRLPPAGHKLIVQVYRSGVATFRVYDRAKLPDAVLTLLRLTQARVEVLTPVFAPAKVWTPDEARSLGLPQRSRLRPWRAALSPDGSLRVVHDFGEHVLTVYAGDSRNELHEIHEFWQDNWALGEGYMTYPSFSPDGRLLLVQWGIQEGAALYDTNTWKVVADPHLFPQSLKDYLPSSDWRFGLAITTKGDCLVWDEANHRVLSRLDGLTDLQSVAFSQDGTQMAAYTGPDGIHTREQHLTLWDMRSGRMVRELWPVGWQSHPMGKMVWWNNDRWLLSAYSGGMGIWDAATGRFLGALAISSDCVTGSTLPVPRESLLQQCYARAGVEDKVLEWTVDSVQKQIDSIAK